MKKKTLTVIAIYAGTLIAVLALCTAVYSTKLKRYRLAVDFSSQQAFEETVGAVSKLSAALGKTPYATDRDMCSRLCSEIYADALSAEAALSTLPFSTQELEQISAYLNQTGDYAYTLCATVAEDGFSETERENMSRLSALSAQLCDALNRLQRDYHDGNIDMDSAETPLRNVEVEQRGKVSMAILQAEADFPEREALTYDGKYGFRQEKAKPSHSTDAQMLAAAARFAGVSPGQLKLDYSFEDGSGRKVYSVNDRQMCVDSEGVVSMVQQRLVEEGRISHEEAQKTAEKFLEEQNYENLKLTKMSFSDTVGEFIFIATEQDADWPDNYIRLAVALDDNSVYSFNAEHYSPDASGLQWDITEVEAAGAVPDNLEEQSCAKIICKSPGGTPIACYEFTCTNQSGDPIRIRVNAQTGKQAEIIPDI